MKIFFLLTIVCLIIAQISTNTITTLGKIYINTCETIAKIIFITEVKFLNVNLFIDFECKYVW